MLLSRLILKKVEFRATGGATVLKVGDRFCERSEQKIFFDPPTFWPVGGTKYCLHR